MVKIQKPKNKKSVRLDKHIIPVHYKIELSPDMEAWVFGGKEELEVKIGKEVKSVTLHAKDLDIESVEIVQGKNKQFAQKINYNTENENATFVFEKNIKVGKATLIISWQGIINEHLRGFYKSTYEDNGKKKHLATTQFEATDARRCFPCLDEPAHKAVFTVSLIIPESHEAISNTLPTAIREHSAGYKIVDFAPSPIMSTYLLAFIIGEFEYVEDFVNKTQIRIYTTKGKKHQAQFALEVAKKSLEYYNEYFDIPYPLPTLDLIAIPDFESGAMENWGAITFRETALLVDEDHTALANRQWVALVIAHEIAHQWFGNLVTMHWWTDLWLNEGFASFIEYKAVDHIYPQWHMWDHFLDSDQARALTLDSLANSHPIEIEVHHPSEISEIFDAVSYSKGASVIKMLAEYLGEEVFRDGLRHYLKKHSYKNTVTNDLWESLEKISGKPIKKMMNLWTKQTGYPVVKVEKKGLKYTATQERFFASRVSYAEYIKKNKKQTWYVPFSYESNNEQINMLLTKKQAPLLGVNIGKINTNESSFIRTSYSKEILEKIKEEIKDNKLSIRDKLGIIRDVFANAQAGIIKTSEALDFALIYKNEREYIVWSEIITSLGVIYRLIDKEDTKADFSKYVLYLLSVIKKEINFDTDTKSNTNDTLLRSLILSTLCVYGNKETITKARELWKEHINNPIDKDLRGVVYNANARYGNSKTWQIFKNMYERETLHEEQSRILSAMTRWTDKTLLAKTLTYVLSDKVRAQDKPSVIGGVIANTFGTELGLQFIIHNWDKILSIYGTGGHSLERIVKPLSCIYDKNSLKNIERFFNKNPTPAITRALLQVYEQINSNIAWVKDDMRGIEKYLKNK